MRGKDYPEIFAEMVVFLVQELVNRGLDMDAANEAAMSATEKVRIAFAGQLLYIPRGDKFNIAERDEEIYGRFDGTNVAELARDYKLSVAHVYRVISKCRTKLSTNKQPLQSNKGIPK